MGAIPDAIKIYEKYKDDGVRVLGLATAFEDFDKNNLDNLKMLVETGEVVGETKNALAQLVKRNTDLPPTEIVKITTMSGCSTK